MRHDRAIEAQIIWGANLIPLGAACGGDDPRRKPARSRAPAKCVNEGSDGGTLATPGRGRWSVDRRPPSDSGIPERKARCGLLRAGSAIFAMMALLPAAYRGMPNRFQLLNKFRKIRRKGFEKLKQPSVSLANKMPATVFRAGCDICDGVNMHLICPTRQ